MSSFKIVCLQGHDLKVVRFHTRGADYNKDIHMLHIYSVRISRSANEV